MPNEAVKLTVNVTQENAARITLLAADLDVTRTDAVNIAINTAHEVLTKHGTRFTIRQNGVDYCYEVETHA